MKLPNVWDVLFDIVWPFVQVVLWMGIELVTLCAAG